MTTFCAATAVAADKDRIGVLTLINGNTIEGVLCGGDSREVIRWQGTDFVEPLEFRTAAIKSIKFPVERAEHTPQGKFSFEFSSGDVITGNLAGWTGEAIEIDSAQFGKIVVRPESVRRLHRIDENATLVFGSLAGLQDWTTTTWDTSGWEEDGDHLSTRKFAATLCGDLHMPDRAVVEFELSWTDQPDFVLALGVDTESQSDAPGDGWRFETVGTDLAIVREQSQSADVDIVADLSRVQRIRMTAYVDQISGEMQVFLPNGEAAGQIAPKAAEASTPATGRGVRLINRGTALRFERLRIARWLGKIPTQAGAGRANVALANGDFVSGTIQRLDNDTETLLIGDEDQESSVKLADVVAIKFPPPDENAGQAQCALFLHGGMRLSGDLQAIDDDDWIVTGDNLQRAVRVPRQRVRSLVVFDHHADDLADDAPAGRLGRLELGRSTAQVEKNSNSSHKLTGRLVPAKEVPSTHASCLRWHPFGSRTASALKMSASGRIVYRDPAIIDQTTAAARALAMQRLRLQQQRRGLNFGELFLRRADNSKSPKQDAHVVYIRSGDVIACNVESIDEQGVHLTTVGSGPGFVPHAKVKAIELVTNSPPPDLKEAKRDRLLTIPRLQKSSPPSHLICSHNGDFLRCRLLKIDEDTAYVEVQLEALQIPRGRIAQVIWFHDDELLPSDGGSQGAAGDEPENAQTAAAPKFSEMAQVLKRDGKRVTVDPTEVTEKSFHGVSEILGACQFDLAEMDQLIFGARIATEVSDLAYNGWKLRRAVEPLVAQQSEAGAMGSESPLIGTDAPEVRLELLDGGEFRLSENKGKIVVLDFWATWCAPCMQTMPLVEEAIDGFDPDEVQLLSINLEEPADHVRSILERHNLNVPVALDIDGVAAHRYEARAIPQLVIIGPDGKIERLYVGGGSDVVEQMKAAISELLESR